MIALAPGVTVLTSWTPVKIKPSHQVLDRSESYWINQANKQIRGLIKACQNRLGKYYRVESCPGSPRCETYKEALGKIGLAGLSDDLTIKLEKGIKLGSAFDQGLVTDKDRKILSNFWLWKQGGHLPEIISKLFD